MAYNCIAWGQGPELCCRATSEAITGSAVEHRRQLECGPYYLVVRAASFSNT